jgi:hypothetical protein
MEIAKHYGHKIVVAEYHELDNTPVNYSVECEDCFEVIVDEEVK